MEWTARVFVCNMIYRSMPAVDSVLFCGMSQGSYWMAVCVVDRERLPECRMYKKEPYPRSPLRVAHTPYPEARQG